jgi:hypothetical protein
MTERTPTGVGLDLGPAIENRMELRSAFQARSKVRPYTQLHRFG